MNFIQIKDSLINLDLVTDIHKNERNDYTERYQLLFFYPFTTDEQSYYAINFKTKKERDRIFEAIKKKYSICSYS